METIEIVPACFFFYIDDDPNQGSILRFIILIINIVYKVIKDLFMR